MYLILHVVLITTGIIMLCIGGNWLINGAIFISYKLKVNRLIIGMTVIAIGTSIPELAASLAAIGIHDSLILGNIIGSNINNVGLVLGTTVILSFLITNLSKLKKQLIIMMFVSLIFPLFIIDNELSRSDGSILLIIMMIFFVITYLDAKKNKVQDQDLITTQNHNLKFVLLIPCSIVFLYAGALLTIDNIVIFAKIIGLTEHIVGITIVAIGTSLPELITSFLSVRKKYYDLGLGNIIGSNIYNILFILGVTSIIIPIKTTSIIYYDLIIMIIFSCILTIMIIKTNKLTMRNGLYLVIFYVFYIISAFLIY
ncbi:MAG: calcium/sodium antiporter [Thaumarchaeota archaeon]|nr:calcium/sodium antiporter [Nitrososphaerota archaeon]